MLSITLGWKGKWVHWKHLHYVFKIHCKVDFEHDKFIHAPTFTYNKVMHFGSLLVWLHTNFLGSQLFILVSINDNIWYLWGEIHLCLQYIVINYSIWLNCLHKSMVIDTISHIMHVLSLHTWVERLLQNPYTHINLATFFLYCSLSTSNHTQVTTQCSPLISYYSCLSFPHVKQSQLQTSDVASSLPTSHLLGVRYGINQCSKVKCAKTNTPLISNTHKHLPTANTLLPWITPHGIWVLGPIEWRV